jgi:hypothetical protein
VHVSLGLVAEVESDRLHLPAAGDVAATIEERGGIV